MNSFLRPSTVPELLRPLILPPVSLLLLMLAGACLARWHRRSGRVLVGLGAAALLVLSTPAGADLLVRPLELLATPLAAADGRQAQAIVVLAASAMPQAPEYDGADIPDTLALGRLRYAAHLAHARALPILASGGFAPPQAPSASLARAMATALQDDFRVPVRWVEGQSATTAQNAARSAAMLQADGVARVLLVTDAMHMPRAAWSFARTGLQVTPAPTLYFTLREWSLASFLPSAEGLRRSYYASYEWIGLAWYRLRTAA